MQMVMRGLACLVGLVLLAMGIRAQLDPAGAAQSLALAPIGVGGLASVRADLFGLFTGTAVASIYGAIRVRRDFLLVAALIIGIIAAGRVASIFIDGMAPTSVPATLIEVLMVAVLLACRKSLREPAAQPA